MGSYYLSRWHPRTYKAPGGSEPYRVAEGRWDSSVWAKDIYAREREQKTVFKARGQCRYQSYRGAWHLFKLGDLLDSRLLSYCSTKVELAGMPPWYSDQRQHPYSELKGLRCTGVWAPVVRKYTWSQHSQMLASLVEIKTGAAPKPDWRLWGSWKGMPHPGMTTKGHPHVNLKNWACGWHLIQWHMKHFHDEAGYRLASQLDLNFAMGAGAAGYLSGFYEG